MPEVTGIQLDNARLMLRNADFELDHVGLVYEEAYKPEDEIIGQHPPPGSLVAVGEPIRLVVSRKSLLHHLPQVYQKGDRHGGHFLRQMLWIFDHIYADLQRRIDAIHTCFDPLEAPSGFLQWLASWVALTIDQEWPEAKKRKLIQQAIDIYGLRGTVRGLKLFLSIFTGVEPRLLENQWPYEGFRISKVRIGLDSIVLPPVELAHSFIIEVPAEFTDASDETLLKVHDIIRMEMPAHCAYYLTFAVNRGRERLQAFAIGLGRVGTADAGVVIGTREADEASRSTGAPPAEKAPRTPAKSAPKTAPKDGSEP